MANIDIKRTYISKTEDEIFDTLMVIIDGECWTVQKEIEAPDNIFWGSADIEDIELLESVAWCKAHGWSTLEGLAGHIFDEEYTYKGFGCGAFDSFDSMVSDEYIPLSYGDVRYELFKMWTETGKAYAVQHEGTGDIMDVCATEEDAEDSIEWLIDQEKAAGYYDPETDRYIITEV